MAEIPMNGPQSDSDPSAALGTVANWAGAAISIALVVGAVVWGYNLLSRDVSGVPVVRAIEGPMREQPEDPGGLQAAHQGLSVNRVASDGAAQAPGDRLVLAPKPVALATEDETLTEQAMALAAQVAAHQSQDTQILAPQPIDLTSFPGGVASSATAPTIAATEPTATESGLKTSLRPKLRPAATASTPAVETVAAVPDAIDGANLPAGTRLVQLGAFASAEIAHSEWQKLQSKFSVYLGEKSLVIQKANSGGKVFYRLRAMGFADLSDARRICSALKAQNADCIPVVTR